MKVFRKTITLFLAVCICLFALTPIMASAQTATAADVIETAESISSAYYTAESYAELTAALADAKADGAGDAEIRALSHAINGLIQNDTSSSFKTETATPYTAVLDYAGFGANISGNEDKTFSTWSTMVTRSQASSAFDKAAYVKFTIPSLSGDITSAKLTLTLSSVDVSIATAINATTPATPYSLGIYEVTDSSVISDNNNVTGRNLDKFGIYDSDALSVSSFTNTEDGTKIIFDITNYIKSITSSTVALSIHGLVQGTTIPINKDVAFYKGGENAPVIDIVTATDKKFGFPDKTDSPEQITASLFTSADPDTIVSTASYKFATWVDSNATRPKYLHSTNAKAYAQDNITVRGKDNQKRYGIIAFDLSDYNSSYVAKTASIKLYLKALSTAYVSNEVTSNFYIREYPISSNTIDNITDLKEVVYANIGGANFRNYDQAHETALSIPYTSTEGYLTVNIDANYINDCISQGKKRAAFVITGHTGDGNVEPSANADVTFSAQDNPPQLVLTSAYPESPVCGKTRDDSNDGVKIISKGSGKELSVMDGSTVGAIIPYSAIKSENDEVSLFLAGYNADGQLIEMKPVTADPVTMEDEYLEVYFDSKLDGQITKIKAFVWSNGLLKPITGTNEI